MKCHQAETTDGPAELSPRSRDGLTRSVVRRNGRMEGEGGRRDKEKGRKKEEGAEGGGGRKAKGRRRRRRDKEKEG